MAEAAKKDSEEKINLLTDTRDEKASKNLLHTKIHKSKSGHVDEWNDNEGAEHRTIQHRSGSLIQMQPDGSIRFVSQDGKMGFEINGEGYVKVTGRYTIVADGDVSLRAKNVDFTVAGDMTTTVKGKHTMTAKNMNMVISEKLDIGATDATMKAGENMLLAAADTEVRGRESTLVKTTSGDTTIEAKAGKIQNTSKTSEFWHNEKKVGDTHKHTGVVAGGDITNIPV
jgi:hypothetical protein